MSKSLGRGLSALIPSHQQSVKNTDTADIQVSWLKDANKKILEVAPASIAPNPYQPRQQFSPESLVDLMESIREHGILQPLVVTKKSDDSYELVAGERRLRAAQELRLKTVPIIVRSAGELEKLELSLIENIQRQDLNPIERAEAYRRLIDEFSLTHAQAAKRMGKSRPVISNTLRLLELPIEVQKLMADGRLGETTALAVLELSDPRQQIELARQIVAEKLTKDEARRQARKIGSISMAQPKHKGDPWLRSLEQAMVSLLQTKVKIGRRGKQGFMIEIEAFSKEELENLVRKILR